MLETIASLLLYLILDDTWRIRIGTFDGSPQRIEEFFILTGDYRHGANLSDQVVLSNETDNAGKVWAMAHSLLASLHIFVMIDGPYIRSRHKVERKKPDARIGDSLEQSGPLSRLGSNKTHAHFESVKT